MADPSRISTHRTTGEEIADAAAASRFAAKGRPHAPHAILEKIAERAQRPELTRHQFEFNVFDVLIDFEAGDVLIENTLDTGADGERELVMPVILTTAEERETWLRGMG
ncbi:hypothetical protein [Ancylobacter terrae]|uniref:hypothetical protein n=1 Tax=Ancylobacter sp. sgz301288 TaxID=3342077 RepID=UPI00385C2F8A